MRTKVIISCSGKFHAFALAEQMQRHGMLEKLFTSYSSIKNPFASYLVSRKDKENIKKNKIKTLLPVAFGLKIFNNSFFWNNIFDWWVAQKLKSYNADVFIGWSGMSLRSLRVAKKKGMLVILERGSSHISFQRKILAQEYAKFGVPFKWNPLVEKKELIEYEECDYISIPSSFVSNTFKDFGINRQKLLQNPYGTSSHFKRLKKNKTDNKFRILYLGSLMIRKGLPYLFEALENLSIDKDKYEVLFVGRIMEDMKKLVVKHKQSNWYFLGHRNHYELSEIISSCDVAVHPSLEEGLSMVIPQIMACGVPVISTTNTGGMDIIIDEKTGYIVPIRDSNAIKVCLDKIITDTSILKDFKQQLTSQKFSFTWDDYGDRYKANLIKTLTVA